ncbi:MAG: hypothetical protein C4293_09165 [Nitrospiraceae bacterium]
MPKLVGEELRRIRTDRQAGFPESGRMGQRWRLAKTPFLLHADTWQLVYVRTSFQVPKGEGLLRRPLDLPANTTSVCLGVRVWIK